MSDKHFGAGFDELQATDNFKHLHLARENGTEKITLDNIPGKQASVKILYNITNDSIISSNDAQHGLALYGDYTQEEKEKPGAHPNIRLLMDIIKNNESWKVEAE